MTTSNGVQARDIRSIPVSERPDDAVTPLSKLIQDGRPPWAWSNLSDVQAEELHTSLLWFVHTYNTQYAVELSHMIPACWPEHPRMVHELPVLYWAWWGAHRDKNAAIGDATTFYRETLTGFQERLPALMGSGVTTCRKGDHYGASSDLATAVQLAATTRPIQVSVSDWRQQIFGA